MAVASAAVYQKSVYQKAGPQARLLSQTQEIQPDGQYTYGYALDSGVQVQESGVGGQYATGRASYISPEGIPIALTYTADENGYQPTGDFVHPVPHYITRALEYIRTHPVYEDSYTPSYTKSAAKPSTYSAHKPTAFKAAAYKPTTAFKTTAYKPVVAQQQHKYTNTFQKNAYKPTSFKKY